MVTIVKHEWHQCDVQYALELDEDLLSEIFPDYTEDQIKLMLENIEKGIVDFDEIIEFAYDNDVDLDWEHQYDNMWTMNKGGYDVTYELGDESSWTEPQKDPEPTHKCTKCKWKGQSYDAEWQHIREDGSVIENYFESEEAHDTKKVCPMCDSDLELTEAGVQDEKERQEREARWEKESAEFDALLESDDELPVPCYSCSALHLESELVEMEGQLICPSCGEGWVMKDMRDEDEE